VGRAVSAPVIQVDDLLKTIVTVGGRHPETAWSGDLDPLFRQLADPRPRQPPYELENAIWSAWGSHPDKALEQRLELATRAIARRDYFRARRLLDPLIEAWPAWPEPWNKRATLSYLQGRDAECFEDILQVLQREPRHFGAICGFAQVCLRRGERHAALAAFEVALGIHPHLDGVRAAVDDLRETLSPSLH
jgi:hypothetical protein